MNQTSTDADNRRNGYQLGLSGKSLLNATPSEQRNYVFTSAFDFGRRMWKQANATANHPIPDSDLMGAPRGKRSEQ